MQSIVPGRFSPALVEFMTSGPVTVQVLEGEGAVAKNRELMGATNPKEAAKAQFVLISLTQLTPMLSMVRTRWSLPGARLPTFLAARNNVPAVVSV